MQVIKEIAVTASLGVAAIILTNLLLLPVLLSWFDADDAERRRLRGSATTGCGRYGRASRASPAAARRRS